MIGLVNPGLPARYSGAGNPPGGSWLMRKVRVYTRIFLFTLPGGPMTAGVVSPASSRTVPIALGVWALAALLLGPWVFAHLSFPGPQLSVLAISVVARSAWPSRVHGPNGSHTCGTHSGYSTSSWL